MTRVPWVALVILLLGAMAWGAVGLHTNCHLRLPPCPLKALTGLPCLSCGLTRCLTALSQGEVRQAFHWHPVALAGLGLLPLVAAWDVFRALRGLEYPELPDKAWARWAVLGALAGTWCLQIARGI